MTLRSRLEQLERRLPPALGDAERMRLARELRDYRGDDPWVLRRQARLRELLQRVHMRRALLRVRGERAGRDVPPGDPERQRVLLLSPADLMEAYRLEVGPPPWEKS